MTTLERPHLREAEEALAGLPDAESRLAVIREAFDWLGTPYHHLARVKGAGVDCAQILLAVFDAAGVVKGAEAPTAYPFDWHLHRNAEWFLETVERYCRKVEHPAPGDLALFKYGRCISHGSIVVKWPIIIHPHLRHGVVLDDAAVNQELARRLSGFWSPWGVSA